MSFVVDPIGVEILSFNIISRQRDVILYNYVFSLYLSYRDPKMVGKYILSLFEL